MGEKKEKKTIYRTGTNGKLSIYNAQNQKDYKKKVRQITLSYSLQSHETLMEAFDRECADLGLTAVTLAKQAIREKLERDGYLNADEGPKN